jgi:hypothetical protein
MSDFGLRVTYAVAIATAKIVRDFPTHVVRLLGRCIAALTGKSYSQFPEKPDVYLLQDGMYSGKSCVPPIEVKADGQDQKVSGYPYFDTMGVKIWTIAQLS